MKIQKQAPAQTRAEQSADMEQINALARRPLAPEEVYTFCLRLCDNEVDRDGERFTEQTLAQLAPMFVGKSGLFDHCWSAKEQTARIYHTELLHEAGRLTAAGDGYCCLKAKAYLLRTEKNAALIQEIEAGIKKEVSVGCSVRRTACSICGAESGACAHVPGRVYDGKLCCRELLEAEDAYEWSFVAVPAQRAAGVIKRFAPEEGDLKAFVRARGKEAYLAQLEALEAEAALGRSYLRALRRDVLRLFCTAQPEADGKIFAGALEKLEERELLELQRVYRGQGEIAAPQLPYESTDQTAGDGSAFMI